ncbi:MAG: hypothetical protein ACK4UT_01265 [Moraxellaceae bacterium]
MLIRASRHVACAALLLACSALPAQELSALSEAELSDIAGQQGVLVNLRLLNNMSRNNLGQLVRDADCTSSITLNRCRIGLELAQPGTWLMLKEYYGSLHINDLRMETGFLPTTPSGFQNYNRFRDGAGNCLLAGNPTNCNPVGMVAIKNSYPLSNDAIPSVYDDVHSFMNIGRAWLEFTGGGSEGYMKDTSPNSAFGTRLSDSRALNAPAQMRFRGNAYVFGF